MKYLETKEYKHHVTLIYNHGVYFHEVQETGYGVLASDICYMIRNKDNFKEIKKEEIEEKLELLYSVVTT